MSIPGDLYVCQFPISSGYVNVYFSPSMIRYGGNRRRWIRTDSGGYHESSSGFRKLAYSQFVLGSNRNSVQSTRCTTIMIFLMQGVAGRFYNLIPGEDLYDDWSAKAIGDLHNQYKPSDFWNSVVDLPDDLWREVYRYGLYNKRVHTSIRLVALTRIIHGCESKNVGPVIHYKPMGTV